ncbi:MAG: glucosamine 6-phosphate synthetase, contains amidotransferase and phosphosugar isomerase domain [Acidimicrobiales bacterium]|nr:glucosamine 6-phosphate synthetase, contains amidotransferase and phosphosugar isomerase domain [Acidimicrobiales bacterium]
MCGIIAVVQRPARRELPQAAWLNERLGAARSALLDAGDLAAAAAHVEELDQALRGTPGVRALLADPVLTKGIDAGTAELEDEVRRLEAMADEGGLGLTGTALEVFNAALVRLKDATWAVRCDRLRTAREVAALAGEGATTAAVEAFAAVQIALSSIDRLEVRGRDSAGLHLLVQGHGLDLAAPDVLAELAARAGDPLFQSLAVRTPEGLLSFAYKAAAEIGELGDNTRALRAAIAGDELLHRALADEGALVTVLGHTRWASVGIISEANAHPLNSDEDGVEGPYVTAALNGDVDNYAELRDQIGLRIPAEVTTDAKVIPALVKRRMAETGDLVEAFRTTVATFDGSVAIGASAADEPGRLLLALRGSGQALYVGLAEDAFVVASEPYGLVEETARYVRMDGETPGGRSGEPGQVLVLDRDHAGELAGIRRLTYDGTELPLTDADVSFATITTRDIDRGAFPHFLLKEISEAPQSMRKTLRGKLVERDGLTQVAVGEETLPADVRERLAAGSIARVLVIGQGTAAVAGQAIASAIELALATTPVIVRPVLATELSGFGLDDEMHDTLVVAVSQSGTTTDTNRTIDLARARGAAVIAIVNRRNSDLVEKSHGVLYTSDGRDVEMSVASTKAFYAQIAAGFVLAAAVGEAAGALDRPAWSILLRALHDLPEAMEQVLARRDAIAEAAHLYAPSRRYWAIVGNGPNRIAAAEIRIKLSELCYKSIACDATEDKKHIDLSSEPLILVCAAGLSDANADDVAKEVAIYKAHKAAPIVVATDGEDRFRGALAVLTVPAVHDALAFVLSAMVGHLFGYEAALAIDAQARPLRELRAAIEAVVSAHAPDVLELLAAEMAAPGNRFMEGLRSGGYDGHLEASTALQITSVLRYARGQLPLEAYEVDFGTIGTPGVVLDDLTSALTKGIDELTRPVDAIKHQAKTVTVGISRSEDALLESDLVQAVLTTGTPRDRLGYRSLRTLAALDPAVASVVGFTRYAVHGDVAGGTATVEVIDKGGVAAGMRSRAEQDPRLRGTKNRAARQREVTAARGGDGRTIVIVPETKGNEVTGIALLHVAFHDRVPAEVAAAVLDGYQTRLAALRDAVTEIEPAFREEVLAEVPVVDLLVEPVHVLAERWR